VFAARPMARLRVRAWYSDSMRHRTKVARLVPEDQELRRHFPGTSRSPEAGGTIGVMAAMDPAVREGFGVR
jgi:hypothetical protein